MEKHRTFRSGRSLAVAGHADHPLTYFGSTGGVWKTIDGGNEPVSDSIFKSSAVVYYSSSIRCECGLRRNGRSDMRSNIFGDGVNQ
jgi:hypothetical protein